MAEAIERADGDRAELSQAAAELNLMEFWEERADLELLRPRAGAEPCLWRWREIEPRLLDAAKIVPLEEAERRALLFSNPGLKPRPFMTNTIFGAYSLYNPGEHAPVHRHTPSASRLLSPRGRGRLHHGRGREMHDASRRSHPHPQRRVA